MRAGGKNKQDPRNKHCIIFPSRWWKKEGLSFLAGLPRFYMTNVALTPNWVQTTSLDYLEAKWDLDTLLFRCSRGLSNETPDRRRVKNVCAICAGASTIPLSTSQRLCALGRQSYATGDTKCFLIQLIIRKEKGSPSGKTLLPSPITTIKRRVVIPASTGSLFSLLFLFWKLHLLANLDALKMLLDYPLPDFTSKVVDLRVLDRVEGTVDGTGADTQTLCWDSMQKIGKSTNFFFGWLAKINAGA